jgi:type VI secretion system protein ImpJ
MLLNRQLRSRRQRLMTMRRESNERLADFAVADVSLFWLLNALNSHATVLAEYERFPSRPPEQVWAELARLAGSMLTFSWTMILTPYRVMTTRSQLRRFLRCLT